MPVPAFIVEGRAEQKIVQKLCPDAKVMILECNGDHVEIGAVAKKVAALTRICGNRHFPIVVQFDREKRELSAEDIREKLLTELDRLGLDKNQFRVGIADRDMESWILYGVNEDGILETNCASSIGDQYEGFSGEFTLRQRLQRSGQNYHKTTSGVDIFTRISAVSLAERSASFRGFIEGLEINCYWVNQ